MSKYKDIANVPEDDRITAIGEDTMDREIGCRIGICVDCGKGDEDKGDRYIKKLAERFPDIEVLERHKHNPIQNVETIIITRRK